MLMCEPYFPRVLRPCRVLGEPHYWSELDSKTPVRKDCLGCSSRRERVFKGGGQHSRMVVLRSNPSEGLFSFRKEITDFCQRTATCFDSFNLRGLDLVRLRSGVPSELSNSGRRESQCPAP